jgi:aspartate carbamoyltransferase catalytic subunit
MPKRDFVHTTDFSKADYEEVFRRAERIEAGIRAGEDFTGMLRGKVLASLFLKESTRTMTCFQSAIIRLGGGWTGLTGTQGTYLATGEEDIGDIVASIAEVADIMVLRYNDCDPRRLAARISIPLINGMCGGDEHASGALALIYPARQQLGDLTGKTVGLYGMVSSSRPMKAVLSALGSYGVNFVIDPVLDHFQAPPEIEQLAGSAGRPFRTPRLMTGSGPLTWLSGLRACRRPASRRNRSLHLMRHFISSR